MDFRLFNLKITLNFNHPFTAKNVVEFWHKWHVSLGKFLQRYILIKNVNFLKSRLQKALFASFIFVISAMWHGGTLNYLFWGLFHGIIYLFYIQYFKNKNINKIFGYFGMFLFFVFGRMIAIDINSGRLIEKWYNYFSFNSYSNISLNQINDLFILGTSTKSVLIIFFIFIIFEFWQVKIMKRSSYHLFRRPLMSVFFFIVTVLFGLILWSYCMRVFKILTIFSLFIYVFLVIDVIHDEWQAKIKFKYIYNDNLINNGQKRIVLYGSSHCDYGLSAREISKRTKIKTINLCNYGIERKRYYKKFKSELIGQLGENDILLYSLD